MVCFVDRPMTSHHWLDELRMALEEVVGLRAVEALRERDPVLQQRLRPVLAARVARVSPAVGCDRSGGTDLGCASAGCEAAR